MNVVYPVVEVHWFDAQSSTESLFIEEVVRDLQPLESRSVGYLIHGTKDYVVLGFLLFGSELVKHHQVIPRKMIKRIVMLRKPKVK